MKIEEYVDKAKKELDEFRKWYIEENEKNSETFPLKMEEGDWYDQKLLWRQTK